MFNPVQMPCGRSSAAPHNSMIQSTQSSSDEHLSIPKPSLKALVWRNPALLCFFMFSSMMESFPMTAVVLLLNRELGLAATPEKISQFWALEMLPYLFKMLYGGMSDMVPVNGFRRRPYIALGCCVGALHHLALGLWVKSYHQLCIVGVLKSLFASIAETGADGALVELANGDPTTAATLQSAGMAVRTCGSLVAGLMSTWAITAVSPRTVICIASAFGFAGSICGLLVRENTSTNGKKRPTTSSVTCCKWRSMLCSDTYRVLIPAAVFLFVYNAMPSSSAYESYVYTAFHKLTKWQLSMTSFTGQLGSLLGVGLYWFSFVKEDVRISLATTTTLSCLGGLTRLVFTIPSVTAFISPNSMFLFLTADSFVLSIITRLAFMPLLTLAAQYSPVGLEAVTFAMLTTCLDFGSEIGQMSTSLLTTALKVGAPPLRSWHNLTALVIIGSLSKIVVLPLLLLVKAPTSINKHESGLPLDVFADEELQTPLLSQSDIHNSTTLIGDAESSFHSSQPSVFGEE